MLKKKQENFYHNLRTKKVNNNIEKKRKILQD